MTFTKEEIEKQIISANTFFDLAYAIYREKHFLLANTSYSERNYISNSLEVTIAKVLEMVRNNEINMDYYFDAKSIRQLIKEEDYINYTKNLPKHNYIKKLSESLERSVTFIENEPDFDCRDETIFSLLLSNVYILDYSLDIISIIEKNNGYKIKNMGKSFVPNLLNIRKRSFYGSDGFRDKLVRSLLDSNNVDDEFKMKLVSEIIMLNDQYECKTLATKICDKTYLENSSIKDSNYSEALAISIDTDQLELSKLIVNNLSYDPNYCIQHEEDNEKTITILDLVIKSGNIACVEYTPKVKELIKKF